MTKLLLSFTEAREAYRDSIYYDEENSKPRNLSPETQELLHELIKSPKKSRFKKKERILKAMELLGYMVDDSFFINKENLFMKHPEELTEILKDFLNERDPFLAHNEKSAMSGFSEIMVDNNKETGQFNFVNVEGEREYQITMGNYLTRLNEDIHGSLESLKKFVDFRTKFDFHKDLDIYDTMLTKAENYFSKEGAKQDIPFFTVLRMGGLKEFGDSSKYAGMNKLQILTTEIMGFYSRVEQTATGKRKLKIDPVTYEVIGTKGANTFIDIGVLSDSPASYSSNVPLLTEKKLLKKLGGTLIAELKRVKTVRDFNAREQALKAKDPSYIVKKIKSYHEGRGEQLVYFPNLEK